MRKTMLYVTLLFWSTEYECEVGYNFAKNLRELETIRQSWKMSIVHSIKNSCTLKSRNDAS